MIQVQKEKRALLKLLSTDLKQQQTLTKLDNNKQELHQQLIAQIEIKLKYKNKSRRVLFPKLSAGKLEKPHFFTFNLFKRAGFKSKLLNKCFNSNI